QLCRIPAFACRQVGAASWASSAQLGCCFPPRLSPELARRAAAQSEPKCGKRAGVETGRPLRALPAAALSSAGISASHFIARTPRTPRSPAGIWLPPPPAKVRRPLPRRRLLLLLLLATLPFLSQMSEDRITEMESGKDRGADGKNPLRKRRPQLRHQNRAFISVSPDLPCPAGWRQCQQPGMQQQQLHLNRCRRTRLTALLLTPGAAAKHRCRHARDAGYHAVDTDDDCQSNASGEFNSTEFLNARDEPETPSCSSSSCSSRTTAPAPAQAPVADCGNARPPSALPPRRRPPPRPHCPTATTRVVTTSLSERAGLSGLCTATIGTVDPGPVSLDPTQRLIDALETLRDSINDSTTSVALQQSRVRNRRRGTSAGQVNYKGGGSRTTSAAASGLRSQLAAAQACCSPGQARRLSRDYRTRRLSRGARGRATKFYLPNLIPPGALKISGLGGCSGIFFPSDFAADLWGAALGIDTKNGAAPKASSFQYLPWPAQTGSRELPAVGRSLETSSFDVVVEIRVVFLKIGEIDTLKELYHADAFIQAKWKEPLLEGRGAEPETKGADVGCGAAHDPLNSDVYIVEDARLKGVFLETLEPQRDFPLDVQFSGLAPTPRELAPHQITITSSERPDTEIELIPDEAEMRAASNIQTLLASRCLPCAARAGQEAPATSTGMSSDYGVSLCESGPEVWVHPAWGCPFMGWSAVRFI
uniref:Spondin domain-containing protein n=1 Tax=Macrostomum lignano TaxID=282301 RepID=A0A1I8JRN7_9PLAT